MAEEIKIAPNLEEIERKANVFACEFNNMKIQWALADDCSDMDEETELNLKKWLQNAIGLSSKMWQVPFILNKHLPFASELYINGDRVDYPKE